MKEVLFILLDKYADWEAAHVAAALMSPDDGKPKYVVRTVALGKEPVRSIGCFTVLPDYNLATAPEDCAAVLLIGGRAWRKPEADRVVPFLRRVRARGGLVGAICGATVFLGKHGFLNEVRHTSHTLESLKEAAGENYTGERNYINEQAVSDGGIITANGTAYLEFGREVLTALQAAPQEEIDEWYDYCKLGLYEAAKKRGDAL